MLIADAPRLKSAQLVEDCSELKSWVPTYSARCQNQCANNIIAYLHEQHLYRHDSQMFSREERIEGVEEGPDVRLEEELLYFAVAREPIEDEIGSEVSWCQPTIHVICKIHLT